MLPSNPLFVWMNVVTNVGLQLDRCVFFHATCAKKGPLLYIRHARFSCPARVPHDLEAGSVSVVVNLRFDKAETSERPPSSDRMHPHHDARYERSHYMCKTRRHFQQANVSTQDARMLRCTRNKIPNCLPCHHAFFPACIWQLGSTFAVNKLASKPGAQALPVSWSFRKPVVQKWSKCCRGMFHEVPTGAPHVFAKTYQTQPGKIWHMSAQDMAL